MADRGLKFGCYLYQEGLDYPTIRRVALECERLGFDSLWLKDNFLPWVRALLPRWPLGQEGGFLECWTTLSALASETSRLRLGAVLVSGYRYPSLVAKMGASLDVVSKGRLELGLSAGWYEDEYRAYGVPFPRAPVRVAMLEEGLQVIRKMWEEREASFEGKYYTIKKAFCEPKPLQRPHPRIWVGGGGRQTLKVVAKYADGWNFGLCPLEVYQARLEALKRYCKEAGRSDQEIVKAWQGMVLLAEKEEELKERAGALGLRRAGEREGMVLMGTPDLIAEEIRRYMDIGVTYFTISFLGASELKPLQAFMELVLPNL